MFTLEAHKPGLHVTPAPAARLQRCACSGPAIDGECESCRARRLQRLPTREPETSREAPQAVRDVLQDPGQPLDPATQAFMTARLGHDFTKVRVHVGERAAASADAVQASAYTVGPHIVFATGRYTPRSQDGRQLLAHELAHVAQSAGAAAPISGPLRLAQTARHEAEATAAARAVAQDQAFPVGGADTGAAPGAVRRSPPIQPSGGISMTFDETGRVTITATGPELPGVGSPAIGIRRNADGTYQLVAGGKGKVVAPGDIPTLLRSVIASTKPSQGPVTAGFRIPTCEMLQAPSGTRLMTFDEYRIAQMISGDLLPMTPPLYEAVGTMCSAIPKQVAPAPQPDIGDFPERTLPQDMAMV